MVNLLKIDYDKMVLVDRYLFEGRVQSLFLQRKANNGADQYFLRLFVEGPGGRLLS